MIEQPCTPPPRILQKEMHEEAPPPIVRTRYIDRIIDLEKRIISVFFFVRVIRVDRPVLCGFSQPSSPYSHAAYSYRARSVAGSVGQPTVFQDHNPNFSSESNFECPPAPSMMMMMPPPMRPVVPMMYQPTRPPLSSYMYPMPRPFGYPPMIPRGMPMPMMAHNANQFPAPSIFSNQQTFFRPMNQQLVY